MISVAHELFIFFLISLQDFFDRAEHPLERISLNAHNLGLGHTLYCCLARGVADKGNFPKIVPSGEFENCFT